jgi:serine/threonine protein kinase
MPSEDECELPARRRARLRSAFAMALEAHERPSIEDYLAQVPDSEQLGLFEELARTEHAFRWQAGELPTLTEYKARFPKHGEAVERAFNARPDDGGVQYALIEKIGAGTFGTVFRAKDTELQREVALKILNRDRLASPGAVSRFEQETRVLAGIDRDGVVRVYGQGRFGSGQRFVVMQFIAGGSLRVFIDHHPQGAQAGEAARVMRDVADSLDYVHRRGKGQQALIHRDLKPENILLDKNRKPYIADFGLAAAADDLHEHLVPVGGTLAYASPEQLRGFQRRPAQVDTRSDVWSLGVILYELLTGKRPFLGSREEVIEAVERDEPTAPKDLNTAIPAALDAIVRKCIRKDPNERFQTAAELAEELRRWLESVETMPTPWDFSGFLKEKRRNFSDRPWLFDAVDAWPLHSNERILLIIGDVGTGKSAFLAELIHRNPNRRVLAFHCCQHDTQETLRPTCFVRSLAGMLAETLEGCREALRSGAAETLSQPSCESDPASAFERVLIPALDQMRRPGGEVGYLLIDALDESLGIHGAGPTIVDLLAARVERLPGWVRIIATTRKDPEVLQRFAGARTLTIDRDSQEHADEVVEDLRRFIMARLNEPNLQERLVQARIPSEEATRIIIQKSERVFLYAVQALEGIERDVYGFEQLNDLPPGLDGLFHRFLTRHFPQKPNFTKARAVFEVVLAAQQPPTEELIGAGTGLEEAYELPALLRDLAVYLPARRTAGDLRYHFVHTWLAQWLADKKRAGRFNVRPQEGHKRLAQACTRWDTLAGGDARSYALRFADFHLARTGQSTELVRLLTDPEYLEACVDLGFALQLGLRLEHAAETPSVTGSNRQTLLRIGEAVLQNADFLRRYPHGLFQCLWNRFGSPEPAAKGADRTLLATMLSSWRERFEQSHQFWVRELTLRDDHAPHFLGHETAVEHIVVSGCGRRMATVSLEPSVNIDTGAKLIPGRIVVSNTDGGTLFSVGHETNGFSIPAAFGPRGEFLLIGTSSAIQVWDVDRHRPVRELPVPGKLVAAFSATEETPIQVVTADGKLWRLPEISTGWQLVVEWPVEQLVTADFSQTLDRWLLVERSGRVVTAEAGEIMSADLPAGVELAPPIWWSDGELQEDRTGIGEAGERDLTDFPTLPLHWGILEKEFFPDIRTALSNYGWLMNRVVKCSAAARAVAVLVVHDVGGDEHVRYDIRQRAIVCYWKWRSSLCHKAGWDGMPCRVATFSHDGQYCAVGLADGGIRVLNLSDGTEVRAYKPLDKVVSALAFLPDDRSLVAGARVVTRQSVAAVLESSQVHEAPVTASACSADGRFFATADRKGRVVLWDAVTGRPTHFHVPRRTWLTLTSDWRRPNETQYRPTDNATESSLLVDTGHMAEVQHLWFSSQDRHLVSVDVEGHYWVWDPATGKPLHNDSMDNPITSSHPHIWAMLSESGPRLALLNVSGELAVWAFDQDFAKVINLSNIGDPGGLAISPDGEWLAVCTEDFIEVRHLPEGELEVSLSTGWSEQLDVQLGFLELDARRELRVGSQRSQPEGQAPEPWSAQDLSLLGLTGLLLLAVGNRELCLWNLDLAERITTYELEGVRLFDPIACARHSAGFAYKAGGMVIGLRIGGPVNILLGDSDLRAVAEGSDQYPYHVVALKPCTLIESATTDDIVAGYPLPLSHICLHPNGRTWCGAFGQEVHILHLEGPVARS